MAAGTDTRFLGRLLHTRSSSRRKEAPIFVAATASEQLEPANERKEKRQRTAALQNAGASSIVRREADRFWSACSPLPLLIALANTPTGSVHRPHVALLISASP